MTKHGNSCKGLPQRRDSRPPNHDCTNLVIECAAYLHADVYLVVKQYVKGLLELS